MFLKMPLRRTRVPLKSRLISCMTKLSLRVLNKCVSLKILDVETVIEPIPNELIHKVYNEFHRLTPVYSYCTIYNVELKSGYFKAFKEYWKYSLFGKIPITKVYYNTHWWLADLKVYAKCAGITLPDTIKNRLEDIYNTTFNNCTYSCNDYDGLRTINIPIHSSVGLSKPTDGIIEETLKSSRLTLHFRDFDVITTAHFVSGDNMYTDESGLIEGIVEQVAEHTLSNIMTAQNFNDCFFKSTGLEKYSPVNSEYEKHNLFPKKHDTL